MIEVIFYNVNKRENSTALPTGEGIVLSCLYKSPCSLLSPVLILEIEFPVWNYCYIPSNSRYYFVGDPVWNDGFWEVPLQVDVLASFRTHVLESNLYVVRSESFPNNSVADALRTITSRRATTWAVADSPWEPLQGEYVMGIRGGGQSSTGVSYYVLSESQLTELMDSSVFDPTTWDYTRPTDTGNVIAGFLEGSFDTVMDIIQKFVFDPLRYVTSIMYFPFEINTGKSVDVKFNFTDVHFTARELVSVARYQRMDEITFNVPHHPQGGGWLTCEPYSQYTLYFEPFGSIALPSDRLGKASLLHTKCDVDCISGKTRLECWTEYVDEEGVVHKAYLATAYAKIGCDMEITFIRPNIGGIIGGATTMVGSLVSATPSLSGVFGGAGDIIDSIVNPEIRSVGGDSGGILNAYQVGTNFKECRLQATFAYVVDTQKPERGEPDCHMRQLSTCAGYVQVSEGDIEMPGTLAEKSAVRSYLEGGIYIE